MNCALARRLGRSVGSGAMEATCESVVAVRLERPGARWKQPSAGRIIEIRALALSEQWSDGVDLTFASLRQEARAA